MKTYQWNNQDNKKKYAIYGWSMVGACILALCAMYLLPQTLKWVNMLIFAIGIFMWFKSYQCENNDKKLGKKVVEDDKQYSANFKAIIRQTAKRT